MREKQNLSENDFRVFTISDCIDLFKRKKKRILQIALLCGAFVFVHEIMKEPLYKVEAMFKEGGEKNGGGGLSELFSGLNANKSESQLLVVMKSHGVIQPLISKMGLQASVNVGGFWQRLYHTIRDNLRANKGKQLEDLDSFEFRTVSYGGGTPLSYKLRFEDPTHFTVLSPKGISLIEGVVGEEVQLPEAKFTLVQTPKQLRYRSNYSLTIFPWTNLTKRLASHLSITPVKGHPSVYDLVFTSRDRHFATEILEKWMDEYLLYLRRDHDNMDREQLAYLLHRQEQFYENLGASFNEHKQYLSENLRTRGFIGLETEMERILAPLYDLSKKVLEIDVELARLNQYEVGDRFISFGEESATSNHFFKFFSEIQELKQQRDFLSLSHSDSYTPLMAQNRLEELKEIRARKETLTSFQNAVERRESISQTFLFEPDRALASWASSLSESEKGDFGEYLNNYIRVLSVREKLLQEQFFHPETKVNEFKGLDLQTANQLFIEYNQKLDSSETTTRQYQLLREELDRPDFEFNALSSVLTDPFSKKLIEEANRIVPLMKDEKHRSLKEKERWQEEMNVQKAILSEHLFQMIKAEEVSQGMIQEKISALQTARLECINQKISTLREGVADQIKERRGALQREKELLQETVKNLRENASKIPDAWNREKWLEMKVNLSSRMIETITELIEAKTIGHHLYRIESKALNLPILPILAVAPPLYFKAFMSVAMVAFLACFGYLLKAIFAGFPTSSEKLKALSLPWIGDLSPFCDGATSQALMGPDLDLLRQVALFLKKGLEGKVIALALGKGPDYSHAMGENLAKSGKRCLIIRCDFQSKYHVKSQPGLLQFLQNELEHPPLCEGNGYNYITPGGYTPFGHEQIQSDRFRQILDRYKREYDYVFLLSRSDLSSAESIGILDYSDRAIVTVCGEATELLTPFLSWGYHGEDCRITFITSRSTK